MFLEREKRFRFPGEVVRSDSVKGRAKIGQQVTKIDQEGIATDYFYDISGRLTDVWQPAVADALNNNTSTRPHWSYTHDRDGNQLSQTDPRGRTTSFGAD